MGLGIRPSGALTLAILIAAGYVAGSIPTGYWLVRALKHVDIRTLGSGTIGASNAARAFSTRRSKLLAGVSVTLIDAAKGGAPTYAAVELLSPGAGVAAATAAMIGNYRPLFLGFSRGGKMVATGGGVMFGLAPKATAIGAGVWIVILLVTRYTSVASIVVSALMPVLEVLTGKPWDVVGFSIVAAAGVVFLHRANIGRLLSGNEHRFTYRRRRRMSEAKG